MSAELGSWQSQDYVGRWLGEDLVASLLELPRRLSLALVQDSGVDVRHVIDLGSGHGPYLALFLDAFPHARGTWVDFSAPMQEQAHERLHRFGGRVEYVLADVQALPALEPASVVASSRALHHLSHEALAALYREVGALLEPGGWVFNLDHVGAPDDLEQAYRRIRKLLTGERQTPLEPHRHDYPLAPASEHTAWLAAAGCVDADVPWRTLYTALIAARKPA